MKTSAVVIMFALGIGGAVVIILIMNLIQAHPQVGVTILIAIGVIALLSFLYAVYYLVNRIHEHHHHIALRKLAHASELARQERERLTGERAWELEQRKLDIEEQKIKLSAYQAQAVTVKHDHALVIRDYDGLGTRLAYEPKVRVREVGDVGLVSEPHVEGLLPSPRRQVGATDLLQRGELDGDDIVLGVGEDGQLVRRTWRQLLSILILGLMGGGKTNTALWIVLQLLLKRYRIALIDRHAKSDESTHARLKDFTAAYDTPVGDSVQAAMRVVKHVRKVFEDRRDRGMPVDYKLVFVVDEFTATMRALKDNTSEWQPVAIALAGLVEDLNYEGRKYGVHVMCIGQAANASRSGGTEIRDLFHTRIVHGMRARQAQMLGLTDEKQAIQKLETGQVYVDVEGRDDPFFMVVPEVTEEFKQAVLSRLVPRRASRNLSENRVFGYGSRLVRTEQLHSSEPHSEPSMNQGEHLPELPSEPLNERAKRVFQCKRAGMGKIATIEEVWSVRKGGGPAYKQAESEYIEIVENLTALGYLQVQQ